MSTVTVAPRPLTTRPAAARKPSGPVALAPMMSPRHVTGGRPTACIVPVHQAAWQLTTRGLAVVMSLLAAVMGSVVVTCVLAFLSISNSPL